MNPRGIGLAITLFAVVAAGCATTKASMKPEEAIAARQQLMKEQGAAMRGISDKMKAGQAQTIGPEAEKLASTAKRIPELFPAGSLNSQTSRAKPEIWQKWKEFQAHAKSLDDQATKLAQTSKTASAAETQAAIANLGRTTCTGCHDAFRGPEIKK
jgi:cytochrome c556